MVMMSQQSLDIRSYLRKLMMRGFHLSFTLAMSRVAPVSVQTRALRFNELFLLALITL